MKEKDQGKILDTITEIDEEIKEEGKFVAFIKRTYIILIALFLVLLLLVNTTVGYHLVSLFSGKIVSSSLNDDFSFNLKFGGRVFFKETAWIYLTHVYDTNRQHEFKACLTGYKEGKDYFVESMFIPDIYKQDVYSVTSEICNNETIISLHSHPPFRCIFSEQDIISFNQFKSINPEGILGLMCGEETLSFFGYES